jgi:hypothetical protein
VHDAFGWFASGVMQEPPHALLVPEQGSMRVSQRLPWYPVPAQLQFAPLDVREQVPPCWQGFGLHASISQLTPL